MSGLVAPFGVAKLWKIFDRWSCFDGVYDSVTAQSDKVTSVSCFAFFLHVEPAWAGSFDSGGEVGFCLLVTGWGDQSW